MGYRNCGGQVLLTVHHTLCPVSAAPILVHLFFSSLLACYCKSLLAYQSPSFCQCPKFFTTDSCCQYLSSFFHGLRAAAFAMLSARVSSLASPV
ncbi:hypothetical protein GDO78_018854 [Eleutherodactylus coqui]|uniref:Uncharacterized protein n=1 Tax=Eleutherodactylus coqui TaxID=57060 RepID=A0A8J6E7P5_ELECQ|nr:hypothetical protein GDO78_018854 [Eleutherodactylus coqui]